MTSTISQPAVRPGARGGQPDQADPQTTTPSAHDVTGRHSDKVAVPRSNVPLVERPRLTTLIDQATTAHRVTLVCGPSGSGKTVACAAWATAAEDDSVGWLSLDYGDRWPRQLWAHVRLALVSTPALAGELAAELPDPDDDAFPLRLAELAERFPAPVTLVIDDICDLAGASVLTGVEQLIRHAPPTLRLVMSGRHPAGLAVAKLRVGGELAEIGAADLACTADEADAYFALVGLELPPAERDELLVRTEGWMTGLRLAALRAGPGRAGASISRITGDEPAVADYLWDEVLASLPADSRLFLLRTSVADVICGDLADALTGGSSGGAILEQLSRENMMIGPDDSDLGRTERTGYRFHPMLADMLRARLRRELPGEALRLTRRAARWLAARGQYAQAISAAARAGDWDFAGRVLADAGPELLVPGRAAELEPVLATFPASRFAADAAVAGALAAAGLRTGDSCAAALHLENAEQALGRCGNAQRQRIRTWLQALQLMSASPGRAGESLVEQSRGIAAQAERTASDAAAHQGVGLLWCALGAAELAAMNVVTARDHLAAARRHLREGRQEFDDRARGWQALAEAVYGDLTAASRLAEHRHGEDDLTARLCQLAMAHVHLARDEPAAARAALDQCDPDERASALGDGHDPAAGSVILSLATTGRARLALADGDLGTARNVLTRLRYRCLNGGPGGTAVLDDVLAPVEAEIAVRDGDLGRAVPAGLEVASPPARLAEARLRLAQSDTAAALHAVEPCLDDPAIALADQVCALVIAAIAARRLGQPEQAAERLTVALALAEPHRMYRPFLDGGAAARSALTVLIRPVSQGAAFAARILQRFDTAPAPGQPAAAIPLTSSELAVLRFLPSHMTNQEIAEALFLSINTVKTHLRSVYRKLSVTTRREAIARGGKLGLL